MSIYIPCAILLLLFLYVNLTITMNPLSSKVQFLAQTRQTKRRTFRYWIIFLLVFIVVTINLIQLLAAILIRINYLSYPYPEQVEQKINTNERIRRQGVAHAQTLFSSVVVYMTKFDPHQSR